MRRLIACTTLACLSIVAGSCSEAVTVAPPTAIAMVIESGSGVTADVGSRLAPTPAVKVTDANGSPVEGATVLFAVTRGKGSISPARVTTGADGIARPDFWEYGTAVGPQQLTASVVSSTSDARVVFNGSAVAGPTTALAIIPSIFNLQVGATRQLSVNAVDRFGNPTGSAVAATFSSGNTSVATVSTTGLVTAVGFGVAVITAVYQGVTVTATVGVGTRPAGLGVTQVALSNRPYAVATSQQSTLYAVRVDAADFARMNLPDSVIASLHGLVGPAYDLTFLPDGNTAYLSNTPANVVSIVNRSNNTVTGTLGGLGEPYRIRATPTGTHVYVTTSQGSLHRIAVGSNSITTIGLGNPLNGLTISPDGSTLYATNYNGTLFEVSLASFSVTRTLSLGGMPQGVAVSPNGQTLYVADEGGVVHQVDASTFAVTHTITATNAFDVLVTLDGQELYVSQSGSGVVSVFKVSDRSLVRTISGGTPRRMALSADGTMVIVANEAGYLSIVR